MEFIPAVAMAALILKTVDFLRYLRAGDTNGVLTQLFAWVGAIIVVLLTAQTDWADGIAIGDMSLGTINIWSLLFVGLAVGSGASVIKDVGYKAIDNSNSAAIPTLIQRTSHRVNNRPEDVG